MFESNWYLFLLIVMLAFMSDGDVSSRESAVMLSILLALTITNGQENGASTTNGCGLFG